MKAFVVYVTVSNRKEARKMAKALVEEKLAACVTSMPGLVSDYWWQGRIHRSKEVLLTLKTLPRLYKPLEKRILQLHSYSVPEILALPVHLGNPVYLKWIKDSLK